MPRSATEHELELTIGSLASGGDAVGRATGGRVFFVPFGAPGDRVRIRVLEERARFGRGEIVELLSAGPSRTKPECPVFGLCGGCAWQHIRYEAQLEAKREILRSALERLGRLRLPGPIELVPCPAPYRYRARTRVLVEGGRVGYRQRRSHALCATRRCPVLVPELDEALEKLGAGAHKPDAGEWELASGEGGAVRVARLGTSLPGPSHRALEIRVGDERLEFAPGVFVQSNRWLRDALASAVHEAAGSGHLAIELFAGAGFLTLGLARRFAQVVAVEADAASCADLARNAQRAGLHNIELRAEPAEQAAAKGFGAPPDTVVLDPPRRGLAGEGAAAVCALRAPRIVYLSCDPATLARDLAVLCAGGYEIQQVRGFDLFPQTAHVEALTTLVRDSARS
ncbi:MAG TPA: class I SAM-dependent RNA methyltransferase [Myxococcota bacterium]|nr:class I SAM-dependent RNA methyltransferase [Myxococcota bacterium]